MKQNLKYKSMICKRENYIEQFVIIPNNLEIKNDGNKKLDFHSHKENSKKWGPINLLVGRVST